MTAPTRDPHLEERAEGVDDLRNILQTHGHAAARLLMDLMIATCHNGLVTDSDPTQLRGQMMEVLDQGLRDKSSAELAAYRRVFRVMADIAEAVGEGMTAMLLMRALSDFRSRKEDRHSRKEDQG